MEYRDVIAYLVTPEASERKIVNEILLTIGFRQINLGRNMEDLEKAVEDVNADIVIVSADFKDGDIHDFIKDVRSGKLGRNPFLPFLTFISSPTKEVVRSVSNSGSDDLITYPMSPNQLAERVITLVENRKPFVVTSDYIGPDRRLTKERREGTMQVPLIDAPNTLRQRIKKDMNRVELENSIQRTSKEVKSQRIDRGIGQVDWLAKRILAGYAWADGGQLDQDILDFIVKLTDMAHELEFSLRGKENRNIRQLCGPLHAVSARIQVRGADATEEDQKLLKQVVDAFKYTLENMDDDSRVKEIEALIES